MADFAYVRVSTNSQCLDRQLDLMAKMGIPKENIFQEKMSGVKANRPGLKALIEAVEEGDKIYIESLSRLGRSSADLISLLQAFSEMGVYVVSLKEDIDFSTPTGHLLTNFMCAILQVERDVIANRVREGVAAARARGKLGGRPPVDVKILNRAINMYDKHNLTVAEICRACEISRPTLYKALKLREEKEQIEK